jgi:hypothetical protein
MILSVLLSVSLHEHNDSVSITLSFTARTQWSCHYYCQCHCRNTMILSVLLSQSQQKIILTASKLLSLPQHKWCCQHHCYCNCHNTNYPVSIIVSVTATTQFMLLLLLSLTTQMTLPALLLPSLPQHKWSCQHYCFYHCHSTKDPASITVTVTVIIQMILPVLLSVRTKMILLVLLLLSLPQHK